MRDNICLQQMYVSDCYFLLLLFVMLPKMDAAE